MTASRHKYIYILSVHAFIGSMAPTSLPILGISSVISSDASKIILFSMSQMWETARKRSFYHANAREESSDQMKGRELQRERER